MARERLELQTGSEADLVAIDGEEYRMLAADDLSMVQLARLRRAIERFGEIAKKENATEDEAGEADRLMDETFHAILPGVPDETLKRLSPKNKARATNFFFRRLGEQAKTEPATDAPSQPSSVSTEEPPRHG